MDMQCFTAYDVRGRVPDELNPEIAARIGRALAAELSPRRVVLGRDMRLSSGEIARALAGALNASGVEVADIGLCGTEEVYHAVFADPDMDGGIMVTASHNPADYNGMKLVGPGARPVSGEAGLEAIARRAAADPAGTSGPPTDLTRSLDARPALVERLLAAVDVDELRPLRIVANAGNGCAGLVLDALAPHLPFEFIRIHHRPDGTFPNGVPNPLLPEHRGDTARAVRDHGAHLGLAWDGDFDRCFFFDEQGRFIEGYYLVGLLARALLRDHPGAVILHDPRLTWNTREIVEQAGGRPVQVRTGHAFIKEAMRERQALYGGEMSAHHYFRDFGCCDSGMLPWLLVAALMSASGEPLSAMVDAAMAAYPVSGEINSRVADVDAVLARVEEAFPGGRHEYVDGLSVEYDDFRFNLRASNTEPVIRLNVETRGDQALLESRTAELLGIIRG